MSWRRVKAVLKKQVIDTLKNRTVLIQFVMFPILALILTKTIANGNNDIPYDYFITMFASMYVGMSPAVAMEGIISEEKEKGTLRSLLMANVKPYEYLLGIGFYTFVMCIVGVGILAIGGQYSGGELLKFFIIMALGILCSMMFGATLGIVCKNQMSANSTTLPLVIVFAFMPMIAIFNKSFGKVSKFLYTQQVYDIVNNLGQLSLNMERLIILAVNFILFLILFINFYNKKGLLDN
ncbi:ABC transporter permease [Tissierella carlieri]|uniref:ABC transporter permease n=1 Tax=Tissierella carlieri TaxID=689904 RepID=A0ABT1SCA8_9FIRM|nr:ABC transporter permease [Tissierella carlieri]MBU5313753.1 ABC transporter permease [Tissierella carlieri]MCQ4924124.1 ABC transporter permease [Tissierella carlieri]